MDLLAYTTHFNGFYAHMLANEAFIDSANQMAAMTSKAKLLNYVPKSKRAAEAVVTFHVDIDAGSEPADRKIVIERGSTILSNNNLADARMFVVVDDLIIYNSALNTGDYAYDSPETLIYEGTFEEERFLVDNTVVNQRFIIRNTSIDIESLQVDVYNARGDTEFLTFKRATDFMNIDAESNVFFLDVNEDGLYEIHFGNDVYGRAVDHNNFIVSSFVATNGELGNNAKVFSFGGDYTYNGNDYLISIATVAPAESGLAAESVDDLRFNIPYHYRRQNRAVTLDDFRNIIKTEYRNVNSVNVWGGEDHEPVTYGKVFISIKPLYGEVLSSKAKENLINNLLKKHNVVTVDIEILDPEYLYINLSVDIQYNPLQTNQNAGLIASAANAAIQDYNDMVLNQFGSFYSDVDLVSRVKATNPAILTAYTIQTLEKRMTPALASLETYYVDFINALKTRTLKSDEFTYRLRRSYFTDDGSGNIIVYWYNELTEKWEYYSDETFGTIDYSTGQIRLTINFAGVYSQDGILRVYATPEKPDFFTKKNNLVVIGDYSVSVIENSENETEKV